LLPQPRQQQQQLSKVQCSKALRLKICVAKRKIILENDNSEMNGNSKNIYIFDLNFLYKSNGYLCILYKLLLLQEIEMILSRVDTYNQTLLMLKSLLATLFYL